MDLGLRVGGEGSGGHLRGRDRGCRIVHISIQVYDGVRDENNSQCPDILWFVSAGVYSAIIVIDISRKLCGMTIRNQKRPVQCASTNLQGYLSMIWHQPSVSPHQSHHKQADKRVCGVQPFLIAQRNYGGSGSLRCRSMIRLAHR
jgi:hypothetical protein